MRGIAGLFAFLLIAIIAAADEGQLPGFITALYSFPGGDKVGHFVLFGILSLLVNLCIVKSGTHKPSRGILFGSLIIAVLVAVEEASQTLFDTRNASFYDLASSYAGIITFAYLVNKRVRSRIKPIPR